MDRACPRASLSTPEPPQSEAETPPWSPAPRLAHELGTDMIQVPANFLPADHVGTDMDLIVVGHLHPPGQQHASHLGQLFASRPCQNRPRPDRCRSPGSSLTTANTTPSSPRSLLLRMSLALIWGAERPVVRIGQWRRFPPSIIRRDLPAIKPYLQTSCFHDALSHGPGGARNGEINQERISREAEA